MNKVILHGRLARDIELRTTTSGKTVAQVSIAVNRRGKDAGVDFIPLVIWGQTAETMNRYLGKGKEVLVEGRMQVRSYDDKNGNKRYVAEVVVESFDFCGSSSNSGNNSAPPPDDADNQPNGSYPPPGAFGGRVVADEEIPF